MKLTEI